MWCCPKGWGGEVADKGTAISSAAQGGMVCPVQGSAVLGAHFCFIAQPQPDDMYP